MNGFLIKGNATEGAPGRDTGVNRASFWQVVLVSVVSLVVCTAYHASLEQTALAEPRRITPQDADQHFKSGGRLSEAVLQEMLVVLKRIDERLERIEKLTSQGAGLGRGSTYPATVDSNRAAAPANQIQVRRNP